MISVIAAVARNYTLGMHGKLPWHLPEDFAWFKSQTLEKPIIMGRKTFDSLGKPLPKRLNIVISRHPQEDASNLLWTTSLESGIELAKNNGHDEIMIIGGGEIYSQAIRIADRLYLTEIAADYEGDAFFPNFDKSKWNKTILSEHPANNGQPAFTITQYDRI